MMPPDCSTQRRSKSKDNTSEDIGPNRPSCIEANIECIKCDGQGVIESKECRECDGYGHVLCAPCRAFSDQLAANSNAALSPL